MMELVEVTPSVGAGARIESVGARRVDREGQDARPLRTSGGPAIDPGERGDAPKEKDEGRRDRGNDAFESRATVQMASVRARSLGPAFWQMIRAPSSGRQGGSDARWTLYAAGAAPSR